MPVFVGAEKPLRHEHQSATWFHGRDGLGDHDYPSPRQSPERADAVDAIIAAVGANPGLAIVITSVVLIQGYRDTAAIQAKLDELILAQEKARNEVVGLEKQEPEKIAAEVEKLEREAER